MSDAQEAVTFSQPALEPSSPVVAEFWRRLAFVTNNYRFVLDQERQKGDYNASLKRLQRAVKRKRPFRGKRTRLHPWLEAAVTRRWHRMTGSPERAPTLDEILQVCTDLGPELELLRGRPRADHLRYHTEALMALFKQTSGTTVTASRDRDSVYDPHMTSPGGDMLAAIVRNIDPAVSMTTLVNIVINAHRRGTIEGKSFRDFFPLYGMRMDPAMAILAEASGTRTATFEPTFPIYCP